jgi:hypothetical protein
MFGVTAGPPRKKAASRARVRLFLCADGVGERVTLDTENHRTETPEMRLQAPPCRSHEKSPHQFDESKARACTDLT